MKFLKVLDSSLSERKVNRKGTICYDDFTLTANFLTNAETTPKTWRKEIKSLFAKSATVFTLLHINALDSLIFNPHTLVDMKHENIIRNYGTYYTKSARIKSGIFELKIDIFLKIKTRIH